MCCACTQQGCMCCACTQQGCMCCACTQRGCMCCTCTQQGCMCCACTQQGCRARRKVARVFADVQHACSIPFARCRHPRGRLHGHLPVHKTRFSSLVRRWFPALDFWRAG
eukprot:354463-Chlamydomonas_euryale.AAC.7